MRLFLFLSMIIILNSSLYSQRIEELQSLISKANIPGLSLIYIKDGEIRETYNLGYRSIDTKEPIDSNTIFEAASLSKNVFAYGAMKLVENGQLDLDKPVYKYFDYKDLNYDERYKIITARELLSHTAGLPNWREGEKLEFKFNPGERFSYSGEGFVLLSKVVEKITGQNTEDWMQQTVLKPLGMKQSSYIWQKKFNADFAYPHTDLERTLERRKPTEANVAHSLQTTTEDYAAFLMALLNKKGLKKDTFDKMFRPQPHSKY